MDFLIVLLSIAFGLGAGWLLWHPSSPVGKVSQYKPKGGGRGQK